MDPALADQVRLQRSAFTRQRKLTLPRMAALMLSAMGASVEAELDAFWARLSGGVVRVREVSAQV